MHTLTSHIAYIASCIRVVECAFSHYDGWRLTIIKCSAHAVITSLFSYSVRVLYTKHAPICKSCTLQSSACADAKKSDMHKLHSSETAAAAAASRVARCGRFGDDHRSVHSFCKCWVACAYLIPAPIARAASVLCMCILYETEFQVIEDVHIWCMICIVVLCNVLLMIIYKRYKEVYLNFCLRYLFDWHIRIYFDMDMSIA